MKEKQQVKTVTIVLSTSRALGFVAACAMLTVLCTAVPASGREPNVVVMMVDNLRWGELGWYGEVV
jgi:hypothetical protein